MRLCARMMSAAANSASEKEAFQFVRGEAFISRSEIMELYQSRYCTMVSFGCIEPLQFPCSFGNNEPMPKEHAFRLYGFNHAITLLETKPGKLLLIDGSRCFPVWQKGVKEGELRSTAFMNVITASRSFTDVQILQLSTYCNIRSRGTRMRTLWEKVYICHAFFAVIARIERQLSRANSSILCYDKEEGKRCIIKTVAKGLFIACLFDDVVLEQPKRWDTESIEYFVSNTVRVCIPLSMEEETLQAIKLSYVAAPYKSYSYFRLQFFIDYEKGWFSSAPVLKQLLLIFTLLSFPYLAYSDLTPVDTITKTLRRKIRKRVPDICEDICLSLWTAAFEKMETYSATRDENGILLRSSGDRDSNELSISLIREIAFDIIAVITEAERNLLKNNSRAIHGTLGHHLRTSAKERIKRRSFTVSHQALRILLK